MARSTLVFALLVGLSIPSGAQTHWRHLRPVPSNTFKFYQFAWSSPSDIVTVGHDGDNHGLLLRTIDSGTTWQVLLESRRDSGAIARSEYVLGFSSVAHPSPQVILCTADSTRRDSEGHLRYRGNILSSTDGGATWRVHLLDPDVSAVRVRMCDETHGLIYAGGGVGNRWFLRTSNAGQTWDDVLLPDSVKGIADMVMFTPSHWAALGIPSGSTTRYFYTTTDAGATWSRTPRELGEHWVGHLFFLNERLGWAYGEKKNTADDLGRPFVSRTTDGGASWTVQLQDRVDERTRGLFSLAFLDSAHGLAVGRTATALATTDGGMTWQAEPTGVTSNSAQNFMCTAWPGAGVAFIGTSRGYMLTYSQQVIPDPPFILAPADRDTVEQPVTVLWTDVPEADSYDVQLSQDGGFSYVESARYGITSTSTVVDNLLSGRVYAVRIRARVAGDSTNWSSLREIWTFRTADPAAIAINDVATAARVRPNPVAQNRALLELPAGVGRSDSWQIAFVDVLGRVWMRRTAAVSGTIQRILEVDLAGIPNGAYQIIARDGTRHLRTRLIVQR